MKENHFFSAVDASDQKNKEMYAQAKQNAEIVFVFYSYLLKNQKWGMHTPKCMKNSYFQFKFIFWRNEFQRMLRPKQKHVIDNFLEHVCSKTESKVRTHQGDRKILN